ncbi:MAG TPA: cation:proton antiporter [Thermoanaerobaculia bacterium]|nr:cation:proton antiporter [Thermoanaerobaculia bacterium]
MTFAVTLLQIILIVVCGRALGMLLKRFGQPAVVGEIAAGVLLGPSLFGRVAPDAFSFVFPAASLPSLQTLSHFGLVLFMFLVGLEFAPQLLRERKRAVIVISHVSIVVPFLLGTALAIYLYPRLAEPGVTFRSFTLFLGIAMSITAFPVLARILEERNLTRTKLGNTVIGCAAVDDVTAWSILAFVVMLVRAQTMATLALKLALLAVFVLLTIFAVRPLMRKPTLVTGLLLALVSAWITEELGVHALFGAFLAGAIIPKGREALAQQLQGIVTVLLPLFFAVTGLRTNVGSLATPELWLCCALVLLTAVAGKLGGALLAARATGFSWRDAAAVGVLMNTRGLMEMVVLNIGRDIGVISPSLFTMGVLMALVTTAMTTPLLDPLIDKEEVAPATPATIAA